MPDFTYTITISNTIDLTRLRDRVEAFLNNRGVVTTGMNASQLLGEITALTIQDVEFGATIEEQKNLDDTELAALEVATRALVQAEITAS